MLGIGEAIGGIGNLIGDVVGGGLNLAGTKRTAEAAKDAAYQQTRQAQIFADAQKEGAKAQAESIKTILTYVLIVVVVFVIGWIVVKTVSTNE